MAITLYVYHNIMPNTGKNTHYIFPTLARYKTALNRYLVGTYSDDDFRITNNELLLSGNIADAGNVTYCIADYGTYFKCYHTDSSDFVSGYYRYALTPDEWANGISKANFSQMRVQACNKRFRETSTGSYATGVYRPVRGISGMGTFTPHYSGTYTASDLCLVALIKVETDSDFFTNNNFGWTRLYAFPLSDFGQLEPSRNVLSQAIDQVGQIIACTSLSQGTGDAKAAVLKLYVIPSADLKFEQRTGAQGTEYAGNTFKINVEGAVITKFGRAILPYISDSHIRTAIDCAYEYHIGTKLTHFQLPRTTTSVASVFRVITDLGGMRVIVNVGSSDYDITSAFAANVTSNDGIAVGVDDIRRKLGFESSLVNSFNLPIGLSALQIPSMIRQGVSSLYSMASVALDQFSRAQISYSDNGNAGTTFIIHNNATHFNKPLGILTYNTIDNEHSITSEMGALYNSPIDSLDRISEGTYIISNTPRTYLSMTCNVSRVNVDQINTIEGKFAEGIYIEFV